MSSSCISEALKALEQKEYLEKREDGTYHFIDPLLALALKLYFSDD